MADELVVKFWGAREGMEIKIKAASSSHSLLSLSLDRGSVKREKVKSG